MDREDEEASSFFLGLQQEDREHYFFSQALPGGGRKYLTFRGILCVPHFLAFSDARAFLLSQRFFLAGDFGKKEAW